MGGAGADKLRRIRDCLSTGYNHAADIHTYHTSPAVHKKSLC